MKQSILILCAILIFGFSCKKKDQTTPKTPVPVTTPNSGAIAGKVRYYNQYGELDSNEIGGPQTMVTLKGAFTISADPQRNYSFTKLYPGTYSVVAERPFRASMLTEYVTAAVETSTVQ